MTLAFREPAAAGRPPRLTFWILAPAIVMAGLTTGCVQYPVHGERPTPRPASTLGAVTASFQGNGSEELDRLGNTPSELLRKGFLLMETRQPVQAIHALNRVLYKKPAAPQDTRSLALYLRSRAFQYRGEKDRALEDCRKARTLALRADLRQRCDLELRRLAPPPRVAKKAPAPDRRGPPQVVTRSRWNAGRPVRRRLNPMRGIRRMTIHHSAVLSSNSSLRAVAMQIRSIQSYHIRQNGWGDIGYHFLVDPAGRVWEGRALAHQGAHAGGVNNEHNVGICLLGNFVPGRSGQRPTAAQITAMENLVSWLGGRYSIQRHGVLTHKELKPGTTCPGSRLQAIVNRMRRQLAMGNPAGRPAASAGGSR